MIVVANLLLIALAGFIAYWWATQGVFSALLHLLCVIAAGTIAFAVWEPLTTTILTGGKFDPYAWGVTLLVVFAVALLVLRVIMDRVAPANLSLPPWANLSFGGVAGLGAGILTTGIFIIGAGHIQSHNDLLGFRGWSRSGSTGRVDEVNTLWIPFHSLTAEFYGMLSVGAFAPPGGTGMREYAPQLDRQATLVRDSFNNGRAQISLKPSEASVDNIYTVDDAGDTVYLVRTSFKSGARDFGNQLTLSSSQVRLIETPIDGGSPEVLHPVGWLQHSGFHKFDDVTHYATSEPGKESNTLTFEFRTDAAFQPRFLQIRGTRYHVPQTEPAPGVLVAAMTGADLTSTFETGGSIQTAIRIDNGIRPIIVSTNRMPSGINEVDRYLTQGEGLFPQGRADASRDLRIRGIAEPGGTKCVRLDISRGGPADIFALTNRVSEDAAFALVDATGDEYTPVGYFYRQPGTGVTIKLEPAVRVRTLSEIPSLPSSGDQTLELIFFVTQGVTITGFRFGDIGVGSCNLVIPVEDD